MKATPPHHAVHATVEEHACAIAGQACPICGVRPGVECLYGANVPRGAGGMAPMTFPGRAHTRRVSRHLETLDPRYADVIRARDEMRYAHEALEAARLAGVSPAVRLALVEHASASVDAYVAASNAVTTSAEPEDVP